jgi:hypothetical protein
MKRYFSVAIIVLVVFTGCHKSKPADTRVKRENIDACSLVTKEEVKAVQGSSVTDAKTNAQSDGKFRYSQCFYTTDPFNKSVSLAVTQADSVSETARDPREFWEQTFGRYEGEKREREGDEEKKSKSLATNEQEGRGRPPTKVEGLGDSAFWNTGRVGGSLYVLKDHVFIRISVGGLDTDEERLEKTKTLAKKALSRL